MRDLLLALCILSVSFDGIAQNNPPKEPRFNHLFVEDGLPEGSITALIQDKEGYIWAGTQNGLVRYDGYKAKVYKLGLDEIRSISSIFEDRDRGTLG
jgi:ligand-binding sensor domain-containing protein